MALGMSFGRESTLNATTVNSIHEVICCGRQLVHWLQDQIFEN